MKHRAAIITIFLGGLLGLGQPAQAEDEKPNILFIFADDVGQEVNDLVDFSDLLPTFLDLAGATLPAGRELDGVSFADRLRGQGGSPRSFAYCEQAVLPKPGGVEPDGASSGLKWVRTQDWKLYNDGRLFHMAKDPLEKRPLAAQQDNSARSAIRHRLQQAFKELGR